MRTAAIHPKQRHLCNGPVLLSVGGELIASGADGFLAGPVVQTRGQMAKFPAAVGWHQIIDPVGGTHAFTG